MMTPNSIHEGKECHSKDAVTPLGQAMCEITPHSHDVLYGRGKKINRHKGNVDFVNLVRQFKVQYVASRREDKQLYADHIYDIIRNRYPAGRFLKQSDSGDYFEVERSEAIRKIRMALREGAPLIEKKLKDETAKRLNQVTSSQFQGLLSPQPATHENLLGHSMVSESTQGSFRSDLSFCNPPDQSLSSSIVSYDSSVLRSSSTTVPVSNAFPCPDLRQPEKYLVGVTRSIWSEPCTPMHQPTASQVEIQFPCIQDHDRTLKDQVNEIEEEYSELGSDKSCKRPSMRMSILAFRSLDLRSSIKSLNFSPDMLLNLEDGPGEDDDLHHKDSTDSEMCDVTMDRSTARRESLVLHAFQQDRKKKRTSIVVHKRSSLSEAIDMYFEDCHNNEEMVSESDADSKFCAASLNRRSSMTDECIISMIVEQMINDEKSGKSICDDEISAMSCFEDV